MQNQMTNCIRKVTKEVLGELKGKGHYNKETQWWSVAVQEAIREKRRYKVWQVTRNIENYEMYKRAKKEAKKVVSDEKFRTYEDLYKRLGKKE